MKKYWIIGMVLVLGASTVAFAQPWQAWKDCGGWCRESDGGPGGPGRMYDPAKAETVKGEVVAVEKVGGGRKMGPGIGLKLKTASGELVVHLGPQWYIEQQGEIPIKAGDTVEVKGVKASRGGQDFFLAGEVRKGGDVLKLRDDSGVPLWAGWRRGGPAPK
ncbi:MAG: DNA-binding protein [Nitrospirae bacterium]|nr:DNA-binding protein [Nitrospirota bacterium]NTW66123.1 DNA-binding protein [Nitrospirota bacterium]